MDSTFCPSPRLKTHPCCAVLIVSLVWLTYKLGAR